MKTPTSLVEILVPPMNPWLKELFRRQNVVPEGVRVIRFNGNEVDEADEVPERSAKPRGGKALCA